MSHPIVNLGEVVLVKGGGTPSRKVAEYWSGDIPWATVKDLKVQVLVDTQEFITSVGLHNSASNLIPAGTVVTATRMALGKAVIIGRDMAINQDLKALFCCPELSPRYLFHFINANKSKIESMGKGATVKGITLDALLGIKIPLPPLEEQKRIAAILDKADAIRKKRKQAIELTEQFLRSAFLDMFGDPVTNPKRWELTSAEQVSKRLTVGIVVKPASYYKEKGVPALRSLNVRANKIASNSLVYISSEDNETKLKKSRIWKDDVLLVRSGQPGTAAIVPKAYNGANAIDLLILTPDTEAVHPVYLSHYFNSSGGKRMALGAQRGQIQKHLNVSALKSAPIPLPPLKLQNKFAKIVDSVQRRNDKLHGSEIRLDELFNSLSQRAFKSEL